MRGGPTRAQKATLGTSFAMVFQDPMTSFNPTKRIGRQLAEVAELHQGMNRRRAMARAVDPPTQYARRWGWSAACTIARAAISG